MFVSNTLQSTNFCTENHLFHANTVLMYDTIFSEMLYTYMLYFILLQWINLSCEVSATEFIVICGIKPKFLQQIYIYICLKKKSPMFCNNVFNVIFYAINMTNFSFLHHVIKWRANTYSLRKQLQRIGHHEGVTSCRKCVKGDEISPHFIIDCKAWTRRRLQLFGNYRIENCHGQNWLLISLLDLNKDTDLLNTQWWRGLCTTD
jgi:hypothetical protein